VDAVHYAPHRLVDVAALGCDFLACSAYKFYGPHQGVLFGREDLIAGLDAPKLDPAPDTAPDRLETGTQNHEAMAGTRAAIDFLAGFGRGATRRQRLASVYDDVHAHTAALFAELWRGLAAIPGVKLFGPPPEGSRTPTAAFTVAGLTSEQAAERLAARGLFVSHGDFYASTIVGRLGLADAGLVRVGLAAYTSAEEVERLVAGVKAVARP
jgi:selenocysteine lyase/cysteine desulfurase